MPLLPGESARLALRCGNRLVSVGESRSAAVRECGEPTATHQYVTSRAQHWQDPLTAALHTVSVPVVIEVWLYNFGPERFMQELSFEAGRLIALEPLGYGF